MMFRKKIAVLLSAAFVLSLGSLAVSCGPVTFKVLMNRKVDDKVFKSTYKLPMSNWSTATTMQNDDAIILSNLVDTLLTADSHNQLQGDLAERWGWNDDFSSWHFKIRKGINWFNHNQTEAKNLDGTPAMVEAKSWFNTFRYIFNPVNASQTVGSWQAIIKHGRQLSEFLQGLISKYPKLFDQYDISNPNGSDAQKVDASWRLDYAIAWFNLEAERFVTDDVLNDSIYDEFVKIFTEGEAVTTSNYYDKLDESFENGVMINNGDGTTIENPSNPNDNKFDLTINLAKPAPYFNSIAAFLAWAPMPNVSVNYLHTQASGFKYGSRGYTGILYSGPYTVQSYIASQGLVMTKNPKYFNADNVHVDKLIYSYMGSADVSRPRMLFESGDISEVPLQATDSSGWNKYVGQDLDKPRFDGTHTISKPNTTTWMLMYNYANVDDANPTSRQESQALAQQSVRTYISYNLNRSTLAKYFSQAFDYDSNGNYTKTSNLVRNMYTSKNLGTVNNVNIEDQTQTLDYTQILSNIVSNNTGKITIPGYEDPNNPENETFLQTMLNGAIDNSGSTEEIPNMEEILGKFKSLSDSKANETNENILADGTDAFLNNDLFALTAFTEAEQDDQIKFKDDSKERLVEFIKLIGQYDKTSLDQKLKILQDQVRFDLSEKGISDSSVTINWLMNGSTSTTVNPLYIDMIRTFDSIPNSPIKLKEQISIDSTDFRNKENSGKFSMAIGGWTPDFTDPANFLHTLIKGGEYDGYLGYSRFLTSDFQLKDGYDETIYNDLRNRVQNFTKLESTADKNAGDDDLITKKSELSPDQKLLNRYIGLSKVESYGMYKSNLILPFYSPTLDDAPYISYLDTFTRSTFPSGQSTYRFIGVKLISKLWTHEEFIQRKDEYDKEFEDGYKAMFPGGFNGNDWSKMTI